MEHEQYGGGFIQGVNRNWFKQHTTAQDHGRVEGMQESAGPYLSGVEVHGAPVITKTVLPPAPTGLIHNQS